MRVDFLASTLVRGGAETMAAALSRGLAARGAEVRWTLLREAGEVGRELTGECDVLTGLAPGRYPIHRARALGRRLRGADALYALDHQNAVVLAALAHPVARVPKRAVAIHTTGRVGGQPSLPPPFRAALAAFPHVLALSPTHRRYLVEREGVPPAKISLVPNGVDAGRFRDLPSRAMARDRLGWKSGGPVIGTVAMLRQEKNLQALLTAGAALRPEYPDLRLLLIGEGPERHTLEKRALAPDLAGAVHFLGSRTDIPQLLPAFDVFVLPSHPEVETQSVALLEAMTARVAVAASRVGDHPALLEEGHAGFLFDSGDDDALIEGLRTLLKDDAEREALAERGRNRAGGYTLDNSVDALLQCFGISL